MRRTLKLAGVQADRKSKAHYALPDGEYYVTADDGERIMITVSRGPAALAIRVRTSVFGPRLTVEGYEFVGPDGVSTLQLEPHDTHKQEIAYYSPRDPYAQAFKAWYDARSRGDKDAPYPGPREEWEAQH